MPLAKTWAGTSQTNASTTAGDYSVADNWQRINIRNATYRWLASGSGTNEYYLDLAGGGDPGLAEPTNVQEDISGTWTNLAAGTAGSLTASQWDYADNDVLGYSTIYVRLAGGGDPDAQDDGHVTFTAIPAATDDVRIPASSTTNITAGLDQSGVAIGDFIVEEGYEGTIGTRNGYLLIDPNRFEFAGEGESYIDIGSANIVCQVFNTETPDPGERGLYLKGSNISTLAVHGGFLGVATVHGDTATVATVNVINQASVWLGEGVSLTTLRQFSGSAVARCAATTIEIFGGELTTEEEGAITTLNVYGGTAICNSTGTITTLLVQGGLADFRRSGAPRTVTNAKDNTPNGRGIAYSPDVLTITNRNAPDFPVA